MDRDRLHAQLIARQGHRMPECSSSRPISVAEFSHSPNDGDGAMEASCELGAIDLYDAQGDLIERVALTGDHHSLAIDLAHLVPRLLACPCKAVVLHHSHPSGRAEPSEADVAATRAVAGLLRLLGMRLHDHIIANRQARFSFRDEGLL